MVLRFVRGLLQHILIPGFPRTFVNDVEHTVPRFFVHFSMGKPRIFLCFWSWKPKHFAEMKKIFLLLVAIAACFNSFCQMKDTELENLAKELSSNEVLQEMVAANGDSLSLSGLQLLNMQLRELNMQVADFRNDISVLSHRRQSALIQGVLGSVSATAGYIWLAGQGSRDNHSGPYVLMFTGGVLCISSAITWICSYTPLAKSKVSVTPGGVVVKL